MEPFSTSVNKVLICLLATTTKICTRTGSIPGHPADFFTTVPHPPTLETTDNRPQDEVSVPRLSDIHFLGWFIRQVRCYTFLSGFRLPWPPSCCLDESTPFVVSDERVVWHLNSTLGATLIASSAYQKWPTRDTH